MSNMPITHISDIPDSKSKSNSDGINSNNEATSEIPDLKIPDLKNPESNSDDNIKTYNLYTYTKYTSSTQEQCSSIKLTATNIKLLPPTKFTNNLSPKKNIIKPMQSKQCKQCTQCKQYKMV
tara:strand:- start:181 stop:546 length:366 start_codon:yes stop_codon:yes gene_type:complete